MPSSEAMEGYGVSISFRSGFLAKIKNVNFSGLERKAHDTSHTQTASGWMTFAPSTLKNPGELQVEILHDPDLSPPIDQAAETVRVTFPLQSGETVAAYWECSGFMTAYEFTGPHDDLLTAKATIKFSGAPTFTAAV